MICDFLWITWDFLFTGKEKKQYYRNEIYELDTKILAQQEALDQLRYFKHLQTNRGRQFGLERLVQLGADSSTRYRLVN